MSEAGHECEGEEGGKQVDELFGVAAPGLADRVGQDEGERQAEQHRDQDSEEEAGVLEEDHFLGGVARRRARR